MIGVSPAFFFSHHGPGFGPDEIRRDLSLLSAMGYEGFQAEIFDAGAGIAWTRQAVRNLNDAGRLEGMSCTAFVAHFLGASFATRTALETFSVDAPVRQTIEAAAGIDGNAVFALPLLPFSGTDDPADPNVEVYGLLRTALGRLATAVQAAGLRLALELTRGNALGGSRAFIELCSTPVFGELGLVFDTGHFQVMGETVDSLPELFGDRILATHLCDNDGLVKLSLCPGSGSVPFDRTIEGLAASAYGGSLDVEIVCPADKVQAEYTRAVPLLKLMEDRIARTSSTTHTIIRSTP